MKPLKLRLQAFGSYGEETEIDFEKPSQNLFLITGDTGAGKSTIFDAIVFALFGEVSSGNSKKDGIDLQSQFGDLGREPHVELTFLEKGESYLVRRSPKHQRKKQRGSGFIEVSKKVSLIMPDGREYPTKETDKKIEEIIGLTKSQFMQVAMIAQGEFMEILRATSDEKKIIFRKLFKTEFFDRITRELGERRSLKKANVEEIQTVWKTEVSHVRLPDFIEGKEEIEGKKETILKSGYVLYESMEEFLTELSALIEEGRKKGEEKRKEYEISLKKRDEKRDRYGEGLRLEGQFEKAKIASLELEECKENEEEIERMRKEIEEISISYEILMLYRQYETVRKERQRKEEDLAENEEKLPELIEEVKEAERLEEEAKREQEEEIGRYTKCLEEVKKAFETLERMEVEGRALREKEEEFQKEKERQEGLKKDLTDLEEKEKKWRKQVERLGELEREFSALERNEGIISSFLEEIGRIRKVEREAELLSKEIQKLQAEYEKSRGNYNQKADEYREKQTIFLDAQAGYLAREKLRVGLPCPVCGAKEHPNPCKLSGESEGLTREVVEALHEEMEKFRKIQEEKASRVSGNLEVLKEKEAMKKDFILKLQEGWKEAFREYGEESSWIRMKEVLEEKKEETAEEKKTLEVEKRELMKRKQRLETIEEEKEGLKENIRISDGKTLKMAEEIARKKGILENLEKEKRYSEKEEARTVLKEAEKKKKEKDERYQEVNFFLKERKTKKDSVEALLQKLRQELPEKTEEERLKKEEYEERLLATGMEESVWKEIVSEHKKEEIGELQKRVRGHEEKKLVAETRLIEAKKEINEREKPDLESLEKAVKEAEEALQTKKEETEFYHSYQSTNERIYENLSLGMKKQRKSLEEYQVIESLYNKLAGKVTGARMDIETFVQRYYLEKILSAANRRFLQMSAGQFELRIAKDEVAGKGRNRGLDLMVYSHVTGKEREIRTLSGGESFMAALALALGMSDRIQQKEAGIHLDIMFIDEGFGSLDDHSRMQAIKVLKNMAGGERLIGIISHVTELKQEIEDKLIVKKDSRGSRAFWQIS